MLYLGSCATQSYGCHGYTGAPADQLRALSLNRLDGMLRSSSFVAELPFKCPSYPRLGERQQSSSTALDELSLSPRLSSNANLSQDLDATDLTGSTTHVSGRQPGVPLTRSVSVRTAVCRPLTATNHLLTAPATDNKSSSKRQAELTSEQRLPFPECPALSGGVLRRSTSCPLKVVSDTDGRALAVYGPVGGRERHDRGTDGHLLTPDPPDSARCRRRRSSAFERDVDLRGEVVADLPVALRAQFPDFEPEAPVTTTVGGGDRRLPLPTIRSVPTDTSSLSAVGSRFGHRQTAIDSRLLIPTSTTTARHMTVSGCYTPPASRCDIQIKCLRWLRDAERHEQQ